MYLGDVKCVWEVSQGVNRWFITTVINFYVAGFNGWQVKYEFITIKMLPKHEINYPKMF